MKCQKSKADRHSRQTKLIPMPITKRPLGEIAMDFITELPETEGFNTILVVTDWFTKVQNYIPAKTTWTAEDVADSSINYIWKIYSLSRHITSERGPQFVSKFLKEMNRKLNINLCLSTAYHPPTDRLSERAVQTRKQYLCIYCHDRQNRWQAWLSLAQFAYYTTATMIHKLSTCRSLCGFEPCTIHLNNDYKLSSPTVEEWLDRMTTMHNHIHDVLKQSNYKGSKL